MKPYLILKTFRGSQTGTDSHEFLEGTTRELSDSLATTVLKEGWVKEAKVEAKSDEPVEEDKSIDAAPENKAKKKGK